MPIKPLNVSMYPEPGGAGRSEADVGKAHVNLALRYGGARDPVDAAERHFDQRLRVGQTRAATLLNNSTPIRGILRISRPVAYSDLAWSSDAWQLQHPSAVAE
jgi:hypothetical protein